MPESSLVKDLCSSSVECRPSPLGQFSPSSVPLHKKHILATFCKEHNVQECMSHINQEVSSLGLPPLWTEPSSSPEVNVMAVLNCMYDLIQLHHRGLRTLENMEVEQLKYISNVDYQQLTCTQLKEQLELSKRENAGLLERERQLHLKVKSLQNCLKNEKDEVQKLQNVIASRASQYNHEMKRKEREFEKLKERLNQLLVDKKENKPAIDVLNHIGRADGKRSLWKTQKTEAKHEGEMYKTLLSDYDTRQREMLLENAELKKLLQQMEKEMNSILRSKKPMLKEDKCQDDGIQTDPEEEEQVVDSRKESVEHCVHAREKLTSSIRLQWRRIKSHVERLDSQAQMDANKTDDAASRETRVQQMNRLKPEIRQCKGFIQTQQQLLQQQLRPPCEEEAASLLSDCYMLQDEERFREEGKSVEEHKRFFEREKGDFTEAAIRLSHEKKAFEDDRAMWLKHHFLNLSPFADLKKPQMSKSKSCSLISKAESSDPSSPEKLNTCGSATTADLYDTLWLIPDKRSTKPKPTSVGEPSLLFNGSVSAPHNQGNDHEDNSIENTSST
ncbi:afadin- and alpha-actinin-binding protein-like isoform 2-T3 [Spinachia spinachia]